MTSCFLATFKSKGMTFAQFLQWTIVIQLLCTSGISATFNFFMPKEEVSSLLGLPSDIFLVREGVVNQYALNFTVNVPAKIDKIRFSWQALTKRPVHYELVIEFADFFALTQPISNVSNVGRLPHKLETFQIILPCTGRVNSEVAVIIRATFHVKYPTPNVTSVNIRRNKICLQKESLRGQHELFPNLQEYPDLSSSHHQPTNSSVLSFFDALQPSPSLLLLGLLGGCAVTASSVFLTFFICLRRKQVPPSPSSMSSSSKNYDGSGGGTTTNDSGGCLVADPNLSSSNSSPACLLRQVQVDSKSPWITSQPQNPHSTIFTSQSATGSSSSHSRNSYVTIASFWNDILGNGTNSNNRMVSTKISTGGSIPNSTFMSPVHKQSTNTKGSDVSPYAYAHIIPISTSPKQQSQSIHHPPSLIEWYSQFPSNKSKNHIYSNHLYTFNPPLPSAPPPSKSPSRIISSPKHIDQHQKDGSVKTDGMSTTGRSVGSESLIQVDGFQCHKNFSKESNVVERFL